MGRPTQARLTQPVSVLIIPKENFIFFRKIFIYYLLKKIDQKNYFQFFLLFFKKKFVEKIV